MYLWEYWRDTRNSVYAYLAVVLLIAGIWLPIGISHRGVVHDPETIWPAVVGIAFVITSLCALVMGFALGNNNVGSHVEKGTADFLVTRPRLRKYFVWAGWAAGVAEIYALMAISVFVVVVCATAVAGPFWLHLPSAFRLQAEQQVLDVRLMVAEVVLIAPVIFGLTYFLTVLLRSGKQGVIASIGTAFGCSLVNGMIKQWTGVSLLHMNLTISPTGTTWSPPPYVEMIAWTLIALAFPLMAQIVFEHRDV